MLKPVVQISLRRGASALHIYRHLLREASYLPPAISPFILDRIKSRFRLRHARKKPHMVRKRMENARRWLHQLQDANAGYPEKMHKLFSYAFGRIGHLRHKLIAQILLPTAASNTASESGPVPASSAANAEAASPAEAVPLKPVLSHDDVADEVHRLRSLAANRTKRGPAFIPPKAAIQLAKLETKLNRTFLDRWDFDKIKWYIQSLMNQYSYSRPASFKLLNPLAKAEPTNVIPATNAWERPTPLRDIRSKLKRFYRNWIPNVPPPLGAGEWEKLRSLASGQGASPLLSSPPRRPVAVSPSLAVGVKDDDIFALDLERRITYPSRELIRLSRSHPGEFPDVASTGDSASTTHLGGAKRNRRLRRVCERVFEASAVLRENEHTLKKTPVWGRLYKPVPTATPESPFFAGVDARGAVPHTTSPEK